MSSLNDKALITIGEHTIYQGEYSMYYFMHIDRNSKCFVRCTFDEYDTAVEDAARLNEYCPACGDPKGYGAPLCWECFKYRHNAWKHSDLSLADWLNQIKEEN